MHPSIRYKKLFKGETMKHHLSPVGILGLVPLAWPLLARAADAEPAPQPPPSAYTASWVGNSFALKLDPEGDGWAHVLDRAPSDLYVSDAATNTVMVYRLDAFPKPGTDLKGPVQAVRSFPLEWPGHLAFDDAGRLWAIQTCVRGETKLRDDGGKPGDRVE